MRRGLVGGLIGISGRIARVSGGEPQPQSSSVDIPEPTYAWTPQSDGTSASAAGCLSLTGFVANLPMPGNAVRGYAWDFQGNGSKRLAANSAIACTTNQSWALALDIHLACTSGTTQVFLSQIVPGAGTLALYWLGGSIVAGVTLANGTFRSTNIVAMEPLAWHQVYVEGNAANSTLSLSVNRVRSASLSTATFPLQAGSNFTIGSHADRSSPANATIGQVTMWVGNGTAPTDAQLATRNQNGRSRLYSAGTGWAQDDSTQYPTGRLGNLTLPATGRPVILDVDTGEDIGDYKALFLAIHEHLAGNISLRGVVVTTTIDKGAAATAVLRDYMGASAVPIYAYQSGLSPLTTIVDNFANATASNFGNTTGRAGFAGSLQGYFDTLTAAADGSITLVMLGFAAAANQFIQSSAGNKTLFNSKVGCVVIAAGQFPSGSAEYNLYQDSANWTQFLGNTTMARLWSPYSQGCLANTGSTIGALNVANPLRYANAQFGMGNASITRAIWDELGVHAVCFGTLDWLKFTDTDITNTVAAANGCNTWTPVPGNDTGQLMVRSPADYTAYYDALWRDYP